MTFVVTTPSFNGPIELLLQLISSHEVDILDVPIAPIVDAFVAVLKDDAIVIEVEDLSDFLLIAAILVEMKSTRLLPGRDNTEPDEEFVGWEERDVLLARLLELRTYAALSDSFTELFDRAARSIARIKGIDDGFVIDPPDLLAGVSIAQLAAAYLRGIEDKPVPVVRLNHVTVDAVTVAETVVSLAQIFCLKLGYECFGKLCGRNYGDAVSSSLGMPFERTCVKRRYGNLLSLPHWSH